MHIRASQKTMHQFKIGKIIAINAVILLVIVALLELLYRQYKCKTSEICPPWLGSNSAPATKPAKPLMIFDKNLGWTINRNFYQIYDGIKYTTDKHGFRISKPSNFNSPFTVLTVGDSFTFGAEVSDHETWQSCLHRSQGSIRFQNAGVGAYGTVQSILRAQDLVLQSSEATKVLISTLVGSDLERDKMTFFRVFLASQSSKTQGLD